MGRWAKFVGAGLGLMALGPVGMVLGYIIGKNIDEEHLLDGGTYQYNGDEEEIRSNLGNLLFSNVLGFMAAIVKADGVVKTSEVKAVMDSLEKIYKLDSSDMAMARNAFAQMLSTRLNIRELGDSFNKYANKAMKLTLIATLFKVSYADGDLSTAEEKMINAIARYIHISRFELRSIKASFGYNERTRTYYSSNDEEKKSYDILGVSEETPVEEIKKRYRTLVKEYHPDKFQSIDEVAAGIASNKMAEINRAYHTIKSARGI